MNIQFLGQGFEQESPNSVGNQLTSCLFDPQFKTFTAFTAFSSPSAINGLSQYINGAENNLTQVVIITGIDQKGTSKEALEALLNLNAETYVFYQPSITIFHPKIYLFEGESFSKLIIGSSNLTGSGLFTNVESSLLITIDHSIEEDQRIIDDLKEYYSGIFDRTDQNLKRITPELIEILTNQHIIPTEFDRKTTYENQRKIENRESKEAITAIFPKRPLPKIPKGFRGVTKLTIENPDEPESPIVTVAADSVGVLLWQSGPLTERDLTIPSGANTHQTGSMLLKKGLMENIDQRHYFRNVIFSNLNWEADTSLGKRHIERAYVMINIVIFDREYGTYRLKLSHNTKTDTKSYIQKNSMTSLSWGTAKSIIARRELIGHNAKLYKNVELDEFFLEIE